ncbi:MAG: TlpA family protein disulfide reductase [Planctomycetota bacterium]
MSHSGARRAAAAVAAIACMLACSMRTRPTSRTGPSPAEAVPEVISRHRGQVLVLLLGMPGCPGTGRAAEFLGRYARTKPEGVALLHLDVPPPGRLLPAPEAGSDEFPHELDAGREVADRLEFFYYPTLYILDKEGHERFQGGCEPGRLEEMVAAVLAEKPGDEKHVFTRPLPKVGSPAPDFSGTDLDGKAVKLADILGKKATFLYFGSPDCPFSARATAVLPALSERLGPMGVAVAVVNVGGSADEVRDFYAENAPGITVVSDPDRAISDGKYAVRTVPFFYVLDAKGRIAMREPFTEAAATAELAAALGLSPRKPRAPRSGAG